MVLAVGACEDCIDAWERKERVHSRETDFFQLLPSTSTGLWKAGALRSKAWQGGGAWPGGSTVHGVFSRDQETPEEQPCPQQFTAEPHGQCEWMEWFAQQRGGGTRGLQGKQSYMLKPLQ